MPRGDLDAYWKIFEPTVPLSRHIFKAPTQFYKTGVVFLAYLNGHQSHFVMVGGQQSARSLLHLIEAFKLADAAGLIRDPDLAVVAPEGRHAHLRRRGLTMAPRVVTAEQFASLVADGDTLLIGGSGAGHSVPDTLIGAIGKRFKAEGEPAQSHHRASGRPRRPRRARHRPSGACPAC